MPDTGNPQQENLDKIIEVNYPSSIGNPNTICLQKTWSPGPSTSTSVLLCVVSMTSILQSVSDEVIMPTSTEEVVSPTLWNLCLASRIENEFLLN